MTTNSKFLNRTKIAEGVLKKMHKEHGEVTPELLISEAQSKDHPLHKAFDWSDTVAGHKWRLYQAQNLIRATKYVAFLKDKPENAMDKFIKVREWILVPGGNSQYIDRPTAFKEKDVRETFIKMKIQQLVTWCNETVDVSELKKIRGTILDFLGEYSKSHAAKK